MSPAPRRLEERVEAVRRHLRARTVWAALPWVGLLVATLMAVAWLAAGPDGWAQGSDVPLLLDLLALAAVGAGAVVLVLGARRWYAEARLSRAMEEAAGLRPGAVQGPLELGRAVPAGTSKALAGAAAERTLDRLGRSERELAGDLGARLSWWSRRGAGALAAAAISVTLLAVLAPERAVRAWSGLVRPLGVMVDPVYPPIALEPGDVEVLRGSDVDVRISAPGRATLELAWQAAGDVARVRTVELAEGRGVHTFAGVGGTVTYRARTPDGARAGPFTITPYDPLFVSDLQVEVAYPAHTGLPPEEFRGSVPPLRLPEGTRLVIQGRASRPLEAAMLTRPDGGEELALEVDGPTFRAVWTPTSDGLYGWSFADPDGAAAEIQPDPVDITLEPDLPPTLAIPVPGVDTILPLDLRQPLVIEGRDDYGLGRLELVAYRVTGFGERGEPVVQGLDLEGTRAALARPILDLSRWGLLPGDTVRYFARVLDNAPDPHETRTREYLLRMPAASEMRREAERRLQDAAERLEELGEEAARQAEEVRDMEREATAGEQQSAQPGETPEGVDFAEREELRRALEEQSELGSSVDSLRSELEALQDAMEEAGQADPELAADLEELRELLQQVASEQMQEQLDRLSEALEQDPELSPEEVLERLAEQQEDFRERLEESLERLRRAAVEQDFRATRAEAEELAQQQEALAAAVEESDQPEIREQQQEGLEQRADGLEQDMEQLQERLEQLGEEDAARGVEQARQQAAEARQQMEQARREMSQGRSEDAASEAQEAAERMQQAGEQLDAAQQQMAEQKAEALQQALRGAADDALSLARRQSELRQQMQGATQEQVTSMRGDEAALVQGVQNMANALQQASEGALDQSRELSTQMGRAMESMQRTIEAMESRRGPSPSPQAAAEQAVADLNQLALMALAGAEQMSQQGGQGQSGEQQMSQQLEQLAQQQGQLNNQSSQLMPLQLGQQAMQQQMEPLQQEQESVAEELDELSQREGGEEQPLGDLEQLAEEARQLARQMADGRLTPELLQRQERLFHRLLDAGRSLEREEYSEERESEQPGEFDRGTVVPLTAEQLGALRFGLPGRDQLQGLSPALRQLVLQYFERLNAGARPPGPGGR